ncbi:Cyclic phosphodiesterase [Apostasia shenzhenica]|uniref:Cyclic phosphodiesterase n=1 Tax=Apostasia shenzhenica TaxID=1088818 RepID=A0A2I0B9Z6_9ASPA|nr:Cyclic phosphodiesterase [Apostasia shenzhenica]
MENLDGGDQPEEFFSVWALPPADAKERLKALMSSLRSDFGGPVFEPHITVVDAIRLRRDDAVNRLRTAAATIKSYTARVSAVALGGFFYQCVYLLIDPSQEVVEASSHFCAHFGYRRSTPYMPHVSLIYGDLSDEEKEIARKRAEELDGGICGLTFEISSLALCRTDTGDKTTKSWEIVGLCDLKG